MKSPAAAAAAGRQTGAFVGLKAAAASALGLSLRRHCARRSERGRGKGRREGGRGGEGEGERSLAALQKEGCFLCHITRYCCSSSSDSVDIWARDRRRGMGVRRMGGKWMDVSATEGAHRG